jgi:alkylhydroperoxidase/carboxymuconolactone decarboxylase family protein YurZ
MVKILLHVKFFLYFTMNSTGLPYIASLLARKIFTPQSCRELIVMAIGMATGTETTTKVHANLAIKNGATVDEIFEVIRILFFTCGVSKLLPALESLEDLFEPISLEDK